MVFYILIDHPENGIVEEENSFNYCILYLFSGCWFFGGSEGRDTAVLSDVLLGGGTGGATRRETGDLPADVDRTVGASSKKLRAN